MDNATIIKLVEDGLMTVVVLVMFYGLYKFFMKLLSIDD